MPGWLDEASEWSVGVLIVGTIVTALLWLVRTEIMRTNHEFKPNHGNSLRDVVDRIEQGMTEARADIRDLREHQTHQQEQMFNSIGKVHGRIDEHVRDHLKGEFDDRQDAR